MQVDINPRSGRLGVMGREIQEGIKCRGWVRIQQRIPQPRLADHADGQILSFVPGRTKTKFPVPTLEIIAKFPQLSAQTNIEEIVVVSELFMSGTGVGNAAKINPCRHRDTDSVNNDSSIRDRERIKRIRDWHTDTSKNCSKAEWIGQKRHS